MRLGLSQKTQLTIGDALIMITAASLFLWFLLIEMGIGVYRLVESL